MTDPLGKARTNKLIIILLSAHALFTLHHHRHLNIMAMKRKNDTIAGPESGKKVRLSEEMQSVTENAQDDDAMIQTDSQNNRIEDNTAERRVETDPETSKAGPSRNKIRKLAPTRPWPVVPTSVSATGPRSAHKEGKNMICISRKTNLGAYMRRCKDVILKDGYAISLRREQ